MEGRNNDISIGATLAAIVATAGIWAAAILFFTSLTGCAGLGFSHNLAIHRVDEVQSSQRTYREDTRPLKCLFVDCARPATRQAADYRGEK
jgi:hypothetical protein